MVLLGCLCVSGSYWYVQHRKAVEAREAFDKVALARQQGLATRLDVCAASVQLREAEERVPFSCSDRAWALHLARIVDIEVKARVAIEVTTYDETGREAAIQEVGRIVEYREEALARLLHGQVGLSEPPRPPTP
jgi:hypothetical protein